MGSRIDVVVPAHNSASTLGAALRAIKRQRKIAEMNVVVVDDGSTDSTAEVAAAEDVQVVKTSGQLGPAEARNFGVSQTEGEIVAFTDADCVPEEGWLEAAVDAIDRGADLVTGPIRPIRPPGPFDRTLDVKGPSPLFETANMVVRRELFERVGGFRKPKALELAADGEHFGEDVLFGWTCAGIGAQVAHAPEAVVAHEVFPRPVSAYVREAWRLRLFPPLVAEVPALASRLPLGRFLSRRSALFDLAVGGTAAAVASRRRHPLLLALPYLSHRHREIRPWRRSELKRSAAYLAADALGLAALLYGSARSGRLLL